MRADRLVAILLMLQVRGRVTAPEVATELEVSERTARRDLDALGAAGVPVYAQRGRGGGWWLAGGGRTDLSGLTAPEVRALFLTAAAPGARPRHDPEVRAALRKLVRALPEAFRGEAEAAQSAIVVDERGWDDPDSDGRDDHRRDDHRDDDVPGARGGPTVGWLGIVEAAVVGAQELEIDYRDRAGAASTRHVAPLGLVTKSGRWYLVAETASGPRTFRVDRLTGARPTGAEVQRPADFDLARWWDDVVDRMDARRTPMRARGWAEPDVVTILRHVVGRRLELGPRAMDGRCSIAVRGHAAESLAAELASFGAAVEIETPTAVRDRLAAIGHELMARYGSTTST